MLNVLSLEKERCYSNNFHIIDLSFARLLAETLRKMLGFVSIVHLAV